MTTKTQRKPQDAKLDERLFSREAEIAVIDSIVKDPACFVLVAKIIGPNSFAFSENKIIYQALLDLKESEKPINKLMLQDALQENNLLDKIGGEEYFRKVVGNVCTAANAEYYANIVREKAQRRRTVETVDNMRKTLESDRPVGESILQIQQLAAGLDGAIEFCDSKLIIRNLAGVEVKPISWLWPYYFPLGMLSIIQGNAGLGKSMLTQKIMAIITTGGNWPNCNGGPISKADIGRVLILDAENPAAQVIKPRLVAMGADVSKIDILDSVTFLDKENRQQQDLFNLQRDTTALKQVIKPDTRAIFIDPITAFLGGGLDSNSNSDVRRVLMPLCELAEKTGIAIIGVTHLNKNAAGRAIHRGLGSVGFTAAARAVWQVTDDPTDSKNGKRLLTPAKINICAEPVGLVFSIDNGVLTFEGETELSADEALQGSTIDAPILKKAIDWIQSVLTPGNSMTFKELSAQAKAAGITESALRRAKKPAGVVSYELQVEGRNQWFCRRDN